MTGDSTADRVLAIVTRIARGIVLRLNWDLRK